MLKDVHTHNVYTSRLFLSLQGEFVVLFFNRMWRAVVQNGAVDGWDGLKKHNLNSNLILLETNSIAA